MRRRISIGTGSSQTKEGVPQVSSAGAEGGSPQTKEPKAEVLVKTEELLVQRMSREKERRKRSGWMGTER